MSKLMCDLPIDCSTCPLHDGCVAERVCIYVPNTDICTIDDREDDIN